MKTVYQYEIEIIHTFNQPEKYCVVCCELKRFLFFKWYSKESFYVTVDNMTTCNMVEAFITESYTEIENFINWLKKLDDE